MTQKHFGSKKCAAEILVQASTRLGKPIMRVGWFKPDTMNLADAIADVAINNAEGACDAFRALHDATGAENLSAWWSGKSNYEIGAFMRETAKRVAT